MSLAKIFLVERFEKKYYSFLNSFPLMLLKDGHSPLDCFGREETVQNLSMKEQHFPVLSEFLRNWKSSGRE